MLRGDGAIVFVVARERSLEVFDRQPIAIFAQEELRNEAPRVEGESAVVVRALRAIVSVFYENRVVTELDERVIARAHGEDRDLVGVIPFVGRRRWLERHRASSPKGTPERRRSRAQGGSPESASTCYPEERFSRDIPAQPASSARECTSSFRKMLAI